MRPDRLHLRGDIVLGAAPVVPSRDQREPVAAAVSARALPPRAGTCRQLDPGIARRFVSPRQISSGVSPPSSGTSSFVQVIGLMPILSGTPRFPLSLPCLRLHRRSGHIAHAFVRLIRELRIAHRLIRPGVSGMPFGKPAQQLLVAPRVLRRVPNRSALGHGRPEALELFDVRLLISAERPCSSARARRTS